MKSFYRGPQRQRTQAEENALYMSKLQSRISKLKKKKLCLSCSSNSKLQSAEHFVLHSSNQFAFNLPYQLSVKKITHLCSNNCTLPFLDLQGFKVSEMVWAGYRGRFLHCYAISRLPLKHFSSRQDGVMNKDLLGV